MLIQLTSPRIDFSLKKLRCTDTVSRSDSQAIKRDPVFGFASCSPLARSSSTGFLSKMSCYLIISFISMPQPMTIADE